MKDCVQQCRYTSGWSFHPPPDPWTFHCEGKQVLGSLWTTSRVRLDYLLVWWGVAMLLESTTHITLSTNWEVGSEWSMFLWGNANSLQHQQLWVLQDHFGKLRFLKSTTEVLNPSWGNCLHHTREGRQRGVLQIKLHSPYHPSSFLACWLVLKRPRSVPFHAHWIPLLHWERKLPGCLSCSWNLVRHTLHHDWHNRTENCRQ